MRNTLLAILILLCSCSEQTPNENETFIVPIRKKPLYDTLGNVPPKPPPIQTYYLPSNFIIDTAGHLYFYQQQQYGWFCGTGIEWDTPPEFINLKPKDIVQLPIENIDSFIKLNIINLESPYRLVAIASLRDTVQSVGLSKIMSTFKDTTNHIKWLFRKATQEETIVLNYKQSGREYYSDDVQWDSTKIHFPNLETNIKFTPPKVQEE